MSLSSIQLDAFVAVARENHFSRAAVKLNITQSALSQRILNLEQEIGSALFVRDTAGIRLTDLGQRLLRFCESKEKLETEFLTNLNVDVKSLRGLVRVAGFSTITRSKILPILSKLIAQHPNLDLELRSEELRVLPGLLTSGATDFIFSNRPLEKQGIENHLVGYEENVLIEATRGGRPEIYLDYDEHDDTTFEFFKAQGRKVPAFKRGFVDDIELLAAAVQQGVGRAVMPMHLVKDLKGIKVVSGFKMMKTPIYLSYYAQAFYTELQKTLINCLSDLSD